MLVSCVARSMTLKNGINEKQPIGQKNGCADIRREQQRGMQ